MKKQSMESVEKALMLLKGIGKGANQKKCEANTPPNSPFRVARFCEKVGQDLGPKSSNDLNATEELLEEKWVHLFFTLSFFFSFFDGDPGGTWEGQPMPLQVVWK
jgi:hypothetical protein